MYIEDLLHPSYSLADRLRDKIRVFEELERWNGHIKLVFRYYLLHSMYKIDKRYFAVNSTQFHTFCVDCKLLPKAMQKDGMIFKTTNYVRKADGKPDMSAQLDNEMFLVEFCEALCRLAHASYEKGKSLADKLAKFMKKYFVRAQLFHLDEFRSQLYDTEPVMKLKMKYEPQLTELFKWYLPKQMQRTQDMHGKCLNVTEFFIILKDSGWLGSKTSVAQSSRVFMESNYEVDDELGWHDWEWDMEYNEFVEAIFRTILERDAQTFQNFHYSKNANLAAKVIEEGISPQRNPEMWSNWAKKSKKGGLV
jgi:hypothetical protein